MCIIACKPIGLVMPDEKTIANMWHSNPDGAGIMYNFEGRVHIEKGFMKLDDFLTALDRISKTVDLTDAGVVMHFRITTHGGTKPENTHPFPISDNLAVLKKLRSTTRLGVAHNGIIHNTPRSKDISDTMEYVLSQLSPLSRLCPEFYTNPDALLLVKNAVGSGNKLAFLTGTGAIHTVGDFVEHDGMLYSNHTYEDWWTSPRYVSYGVWDKSTGKWNYDSYTYTPAPKPYAGDTRLDYIYDGEDYWEGELVEPHYLMPLTDVEGAYYMTEDGEIHEDDNYDVFIDAKGRPWFLDVDTGLTFLDKSIIGTYNSEGMRLRFDYKKSDLMDCYDWDDKTGCYPDTDK